jgi:glucokinase
MIHYIISCDLGRTKCAAGIIKYDTHTSELTCQKTCSVKLSETNSLAELIQRIESGLNIRFSESNAICFGAAGQYNGETLMHENPYPYPMHFAALAKTQHWPPFVVIHDYAPILCATFTNYMQTPGNIKKLHSAVIHPYGRRVALGLGTGLGMKDGALLPNGDFWLGQNEVGHTGITYPPATSLEKKHLHHELMHFLQERHSSVTFETILSGPGTAQLYEFFYPEREKLSPEEVGMAMREGKTLEMNHAFAWYIGLLIGTIQLTFMPEGGVWITGGVALSHLDIFDLEDFNAGINASPAYATQRSHYPLGILVNPDHAIMGGGYYALKRLLGNSA